MKVIAQRGENLLLVSTRTLAGREWARIWDRRRNVMGDEGMVVSITKFGYWETYTGPKFSDAELEAVPIEGRQKEAGVGGQEGSPSRGTGDLGRARR